MNSVEVGVKFQSSVDGYITGIRFYKHTVNTGTHTGHLWTSNGTLLGTATFTNESASGWQEATFAAPIAVTRRYHLRRVVLRAERAIRRQRLLLRLVRCRPTGR